MDVYFVKDVTEFLEAVDIIKNDNIKQATIVIKNDINHSHLIRFLKVNKLIITGTNKQKYCIYIDPREVSSNPNWKFNTTLFFHSSNSGISYSKLHFTYLIEEYEFISLINNYNLETNKKTEKIDFNDGQILDSFGIVLMEFYNSKIDFKDCVLENNTNRTFEIIVKKQSLVTFENCHFNGDFNFTFDNNSKIIIH